MTDPTQTTETSEELRARVEHILRDRLGILVPAPEANLLESGLMDSLSLVELLLALEGDLGIVVSWDTLEIEEFTSVSTIAHFVERSRSS